MKKLSEWIVRRRIVILICMIVLTAVGVFWIPRVKVNDDLTRYLPSDSSMRAGKDLLDREFPDDEEVYTVRVMFRGLTAAQKSEIQKTLQELEHVTGVRQPEENGEYTLYTLETSFGYDTPEEAALEEAVAKRFEQMEVTIRNDDDSSPAIPISVYLVAFGIMTVVLLISCSSYIEPLLFMITIGMAILLGLGSNVFLGEISDVSYGIAAVLQLALSMDYSIILMNRYRQELLKTDDRKTAMAAALRAAFGSITGSAVTTIVGLLVLLFMSFKIGADIGLVLAKGVAFSMLCVFTVLPALILLCGRLIEKTEKKHRRERKARKNPLAAVGRISYRFRGVIAGVFALLLVGAGLLQMRTSTAYTLAKKDPISEHFTTENPLVLVYEKEDEAGAALVAADLTGETAIREITAYATTLGKPYTAAEMVEVLAETGGGAGLSEKTLSLLYYDSFGGELFPMTLSDFAATICDDLGRDEQLSAYFDAQLKRQLQQLRPFVDKKALEQPRSSTELAALLGLDKQQTAGLFALYYGEQYTPDKTLSVHAFLTFLCDRVLVNENYAAAFDSASVASLRQARTLADLTVSQKALSVAEMTQVLGGLSDKADQNTVSLIYLYAASRQHADPTRTLSPDVFFHYLSEKTQDARLAPFFNEELRTQIADAVVQLDKGVRQLRGERFARMILTTTLPEESEQTTAFITRLQKRCDDRLGGAHYLVGNSAMVQEMQQGFSRELLLITLLTAISIFVVVAVTFRSLIIPALLVLIVQCGVWITVTAIGAYGGSMYFLALLIVECILMGATIDYGILYTGYYREKRQTLGVQAALEAAYRGSIHTILTSGSMMVLITASIGPLFHNLTIEQIVRTLSIGCLSAILLILLFLPSLLAVFDRAVLGRRRAAQAAPASAPADASSAPADTSPAPADTSPAPADTSSAPADTSSAPADTSPAPAPSGTSPSPADNGTEQEK